MSAPTMEQRLADFRAMLKRAARIHLAYQRNRGLLPDSEAWPLVRLTEETAALCANWNEAAHRAGTGALTDQYASDTRIRALRVAARCLDAIRSDDDLSGDPLSDLLAEIAATGEEWLGEAADEWMDLGVDPCARIQHIVQCLGEVAAAWPIAPDHPSPCGDNHVVWKFGTLARLTFEAVCAAVAADNGRWEAEA